MCPECFFGLQFSGVPLGRSGHARTSGVINFRSDAFGPEWPGASCGLSGKLPECTGAFCDRSGIFRSAAFGPEWNGVLRSAAFGPKWSPVGVEELPARDLVCTNCITSGFDDSTPVLAPISKDELLVDQALEQASFLKRVRFAPETLSAEAHSSAPHRRMLAPCSDVCHPVKFRKSNSGILASEDVPVDDDPIPGAAIECHDRSIPPSDGESPEMEPVAIIDPDITPSPISRILKKYVGSPNPAKKKTQSKTKPCKSK
ncbi:hypothetical protein Nepgr_027206 [Nepenthes gracilis]|uniref:Uncharacterized protein n=1 Tax=Nepenthes gracilis TaxID=150966 RepID=A0AAD3Y195_NEPGR|nr:hypothetical protein Nepgr_027206 [Nepenthes gracilis]